LQAAANQQALLPMGGLAHSAKMTIYSDDDFFFSGTTSLTFSMIFCSQESMASIIVHK